MFLLRNRLRLLTRSLSTLAEFATPESERTIQLFTWGRGSSGQLGGGKEETRLYPTLLSSIQLSSPTPAPTPGRLGVDPTSTDGEKAEVGVACGLFHSALVVDGKVWVWGKGDGGRLGLGDETSLFQPTFNKNISEVGMLALGGVHSTALTRNGEVYSWGYGGFGALGHSVYYRELLPRRVNGPWKGIISHLATSGAHTAAITDSGELYTWGRDEGEGRLGLGSGGGPGEGGSLGTPSKVHALPVPVSAVCCGGFFTTALTQEGQIWNWGANSNFELGRGDMVSDWKPRPISSLEGVSVVQIASGGYHSIALTEKGEVFSWGHGGHGQLGHGQIQNQKVPLLVDALAHENIVYIACGGSSSAAITDKGKLYMWGYAKDCQLGSPGLPEIQATPVEVKFLTDEDEELGSHRVISVAVGASHAMCLVLRQQADDS